MHYDVVTPAATVSYGHVSADRQAQVMHELEKPRECEDKLDAILREIQRVTHRNMTEC